MRVKLGCLVLVLSVGLGAATVDARSGGREKFVKRADAICENKRADAERKIASGIKYLERRRVKRAGHEFAAAYRELRQGYRRVERLPRPFRDHKEIAKWLHRERNATAKGVDAAVALQRRRLEAAARLTAKSAALERKAYAAVHKLDFDKCRPL